MPNEPLRESCYEREGAGKLHRFSCFDAICFSFTPIFMTHQWVYSRFNHFIFYLMPCLETNRIYPNLIDSLGKKGFVPIKCRPVGAGGAGGCQGTHPQILTDQFTLAQPGPGVGRSLCPPYYYCLPRFLDLPTALLCITYLMYIQIQCFFKKVLTFIKV